MSVTLATDRYGATQPQPAPRSRYTAVVGPLMHRAVSLVMIVALAGTPAVAAACAALCMPGMAHGTSMAMADKVDHHDDHGSMPASETRATTDESATHASGHHHSRAQKIEPTRSAPRKAAVDVTVSDRSCCTNTDAALSASVAAARADTSALLATASAEIPTAFHSQISLRREPGYSPPVAPPSPTRAPLVLRV